MSEPLPRDLFPDAPPVQSMVTPAPVRVVNGSISDVRIIDVDMPFWSMVQFMVKWALATIPAIFVLAMGVALVMFVLALIGFGSLLR